MGRRLELQTILETILGTRNVYFQPPANVNLQYDCIIYNQDDGRTLFAGNQPYRHTKRYQLTLITRDPDTPVYDKLAELPMCSFDRSYAAENLNHYVFNIFF